MSQHTATQTLRRMSLAALLLGFVATVGTIGYHVLGEGRWSWLDCAYMTGITLSTVGFGETLHGMDNVPVARIWTLVLILVGSGSLVFFVSSLTAAIVEGDIQGAIRRRRVQAKIDSMRDHVIVVGTGATGIHVLGELVASRAPFVAIDTDHERLKRLSREFGERLLYVHGDATNDDVLERAGIMRAKGLAATLREDKDNVFVSITARALNPNLRIVAKVTEDSAETKLKRAGVDVAVSPSAIGGMRLASELVRPSVVQFLDRMRSQDLRVEEVPIPKTSSLLGAPLRETRIRQRNALIMAVREPDGSYSYNPGPDFILVEGQVLVVLCRSDDIEALRTGIADGSIGRVTP